MQNDKKKFIRNIIFLTKIDMKGKLKGNILAFLTHFSVTFALRTCGRKLANEPKSRLDLRAGGCDARKVDGL